MAELAQVWEKFPTVLGEVAQQFGRQRGKSNRFKGHVRQGRLLGSRRSTGGRRPQAGPRTREPETGEDPLNHGRVVDRGDQRHPPGAARTAQDVQAEGATHQRHYSPGGFRHDGPTFGYEEVPVPPGTHRLEATLADAQAERAKSQGRGRCEVTQQVEIARGQALLVEFSEESGLRIG